MKSEFRKCQKCSLRFYVTGIELRCYAEKGWPAPCLCHNCQKESPQIESAQPNILGVRSLDDVRRIRGVA